MKHFLLVSLVWGAGLVGCQVPVLVANPFEGKVEIFEWGLFQVVGPVEVESDAEKVAGEVNIIDDVRLVRRTTSVSMQMGTTFGIRYRLVPNDGKDYEIGVRIVFPDGGLTNPETGKLQLSSFSSFVLNTEDADFDVYTFDHAWEMRPGEWTFQLLVDGRVAAAKTFVVR